MSFKKLAFAAVALVGAFASKAEAQEQECATDWLNTGVVAADIFSVPTSQWDKTFLSSIGGENRAKLIENLQDRVQDRLVRDSGRIFDGLQRNLNRETAPDWRRIESNAHFIFLPVLAKIKEGSIDLVEGRAEASLAIGNYISSTTRELTQLPLNPAYCPRTPTTAPAPAAH